MISCLPRRTTTRCRVTNSPTRKRFSTNNTACIIVDFMYPFFLHSYIYEEHALEIGPCQAFETARAYYSRTMRAHEQYQCVSLMWANSGFHKVRGRAARSMQCKQHSPAAHVPKAALKFKTSRLPNVRTPRALGCRRMGW